MKCRLVRITDNGHTRTKEIMGECDEPPFPGKRFEMWNEDPLDRSNGEDTRWISTSEVQSMYAVAGLERAFIFQTHSGTKYQWEELA